MDIVFIRFSLPWTRQRQRARPGGVSGGALTALQRV